MVPKGVVYGGPTGRPPSALALPSWMRHPQSFRGYRTQHPICEDCLPILQAFVAWRSTHPNRHLMENALDNLEALWSALIAQQRISPRLPKRGPGLLYSRAGRWGPMFHVPELSSYVISKLRALPAPSDQFSSNTLSTEQIREAKATQLVHLGPSEQPHRSLLLDLPPELLQLVSSYLDAATNFDLRLTCRLLAAHIPADQRFWRTQLTSGPLFGFLITHTGLTPDGPVLDEATDIGRQFDEDILGAKPEAVSATTNNVDAIKATGLGRAYDWKALVRLMAQSESFEEGGPLFDAPPQFRYSRYIWANLLRIERREPLPEYFRIRPSHM